MGTILISKKANYSANSVGRIDVFNPKESLPAYDNLQALWMLSFNTNDYSDNGRDLQWKKSYKPIQNYAEFVKSENGNHLFTNNFDVALFSEFTIGFYISADNYKTTVEGGYGKRISIMEKGDFNHGFVLTTNKPELNANEDGLLSCISGENKFFTIPDILSTNTWHYVMFSCKRGLATSHLLLDGVISSTQADFSSIDDTAYSNFILGGGYLGVIPELMRIKKVAVWNKQLTTSEMSEVYDVLKDPVVI